MGWLPFLLLPGALLLLRCSDADNPSRRTPVCTSCDEFVGKTCRKNAGFCKSKSPDFACQTREVYTQHYTAEYVYQYSILSCPRRCVDYIRITNRKKDVFLCCNENYCNSLSVKDELPFKFLVAEELKPN